MTNRVLIGRRNDGSYGMDLSQAGVDVTTAPDTALTFSTKPYFGSAASIHASGTVARGGTAYWPQLPYVPLVIVYINDGGLVLNNKRSGPYGAAASGGGTDNTIYYEPFAVINQSAIVMVSLQNRDTPYQYCRYIALRIPGGQS